MRVAIIDCGAGNLHSVRKAFAHQLAAHSVIASEAKQSSEKKNWIASSSASAVGVGDTPRNDAAPATLDIITNAAALADATHIVLPGVGAFADCMNGLNALPGMRDALEEKVLRGKTPFLGICVGMQLLFERGYEHGTHAGLGWFQGEVRALTPADPTLKIPHMGWNRLRLGRMDFGTAVPRESPLPQRGRGLGEGASTLRSSLTAPSPNLSPVGGEELQRHPILHNIHDGDFVYFVHSYAATNTKADDIAAQVDYGGDVVAMVARENIVATQFHPEKSQRVGLQLIANFLEM